MFKSIESQDLYTENGEAAEAINRVIILDQPPLKSRGGGQGERVKRQGDALSPDIEETIQLVESAGGQVCGVLTSARTRPDPATFIGAGKLEELKDAAAGVEADLVVVNQPITPIQERNIERAINARILDRTGLILDIFSLRAASKEGKLQVELAQLKHLSTRLVRGWTHLERQKGGIGLRGPGETQLETDRRLISQRIKSLSNKLTSVQSQRKLRRRARKRAPVAVVSLVGYTNAGKSTLFNRLTGARVYAEDQLFATLDPTMRRLHIPKYGEVVLSDTVGFIKDLPHTLVAAFHSTLEEVIDATLLLHIYDGANPEHPTQIDEVDKVLAEIGAAEIPVVMVNNKIDQQAGVSAAFSGAKAVGAEAATRSWVNVSAASGEGLELIAEAIYAELGRGHQAICLTIPPAQARLRARLYEKCEVLDESLTDEGGWCLQVNLSEAERGWLHKQAGFEDTMIA